MAFQQSPLCVHHFLKYAQDRFPRIANFCISPFVKNQEANLPGKPVIPARVQPRRAAKDAVSSYSDSTGRKGKATSPAAGVQKKQKTEGRKVVPRAFKGDVSALKALILAKEAELRGEDDEEQEDCKPWECDKCQKEAAEKLKDMPLKKGAKRDRSPNASMAPAQTGTMSTEWKGADIPKSHMFSWEGEKFAVDVCGETMVLML